MSDRLREDGVLGSRALAAPGHGALNPKEPRDPGEHRQDAAAAALRTVRMTYEEFATALKDALRNFTRADMLIRSPLLRSRLFAARENAGATDLKTWLKETADELFANPCDERLRQALELGYFRPACKQQAAAERLGLAFSTYRRTLATAVDRLARWLWERGQTEPPRVPELSLVVLPFTNLSGDCSWDYLVDSITENLTTSVSRLPDTVVIEGNAACWRDKGIDTCRLGRELGVRYALAGSVQVQRDRIRINARLSDTETGAQLWSERFDRPRTDLLELQDVITAHLARSLEVELVCAASRRVMREGRAESDSRAMALCARDIWNRPYSAERASEARRLFEAALQLDPCNVVALLGLADVHMREVNFFVSRDRAEQIRIADAAVSRALALAQPSAYAHFSRGTVLAAMCAPERAQRAFDLAITIDGNLARSHAARGFVEIFLGRAELVEEHVSRAMRLCPHDPLYGTWLAQIGMADLYIGRLDRAAERLRKSIEMNPNCGWSQLTLAAALSLSGRNNEAAQVCAVARRVVPGVTIAKLRREALGDEPNYLAQHERFCAALAKVGLPPG